MIEQAANAVASTTGTLGAGPAPSAPHLSKKTMQTHRWLKTLNQLVLYADFSDAAKLDAARECWAWIEDLLEKVEAAVSLSRPESDVSRFNRASAGEWVPVSSITAQIVDLALRMNGLTEGRFDPSTMHLTDLWGFSPRTFAAGYEPIRPYDRPRDEDGSLPAPERRYRDLFRDGARLSGVEVQMRKGRRGLLKTAEPVRLDGVDYQLGIDLGGIAKGWVADEALRMVARCGFDHAMYSCESRIAMSASASAIAQHRGTGEYTVYLVNPRPMTGVPNYLQAYVRDRCVATSGDYGRCYVRDGVLFSHIVDPVTGMPLNVSDRMAYGDERRQRGLCTVTLLGPSAGEADALATALCLMGPQGAVDFYNEHLAHAGWDLVAVAYDSENPDRLDLITSLREDAYHLIDPRMSLAVTRDADGRLALVK